MSDTGGPAFPYSRLGSDADGMTLRDYFAAKAMQGLLAQSEGGAFFSPVKEAANYAYSMADAMLKARNQ
jgi:hypothetical protein